MKTVGSVTFIRLSFFFSKEKSDHYWPTDSEPKYYGDLQVVVLHETHLPDWTITEFRVCHVSFMLWECYLDTYIATLVCRKFALF